VSRTRVKICGITNSQDAQAATQAGVDAIGLVFYPPSSRFVSIEQAQDIVRSLPPFVSVVALFVDAEEKQVKQALDHLPIDCLQFHGQESESWCSQFSKPYMKAISMKPEVKVIEKGKEYHSACGLLLDTYDPIMPGGTGKIFDWARIPKESSVPLILAGGLTVDNVSQALAQDKNLYGVDVSGGVESQKGIKDYHKMQNFIRQVQRADALLL
jgi:phosphoribosylanthranilate isomerase